MPTAPKTQPIQRRRRSSVSLDAVKPYRRSGSLHEYLRRLILDGAIPNGASFSQVELAERLGVSRTPLREAMKMLQAEGIVQADHGRRTRVTALDVGEQALQRGALVLIVALIGTGFTRKLAAERRSAGRRFGAEAVSGSSPLSRMNSFALALLLGGLRGPLVMMLWAKTKRGAADRSRTATRVQE